MELDNIHFIKDDPMKSKDEALFFRKMEVGDLEKVLSIAATDLSNPWSKNMFFEELSNPSSHCFVLFERRHSHWEELLGYICFRNIDGESELLSIAIASAYRQRGLGKMLMEFYIDFCNQRGVKKFYLEVNPQNISALRLYHSFSYKEVGRRKKFYRNREDALVMERSIQRIVKGDVS